MPLRRKRCCSIGRVLALPDAAEINTMPPAMMRLTVINQFYAPDISPTARLAASLAEHRAALGDEVTVVASHGGYIQRGLPVDDLGNPRVHRIWTPQLGRGTWTHRLIDWITFLFLAFWRVVTLPQQDVIVALTTPPYLALVAVFHKLIHPQTRIVLWNMDTYPDVIERTGHIQRGGLLSRLLRAINHAMFSRLDMLICLDAAMADLLVSEYSPEGQTLMSRVIPNWESAAEYSSQNLAKIRDQSMAPLPNQKMRVLYMGNAGYGHEFDTILAAADILRNDPFTFVFVGGGSRRAVIEAEQQSRALRNVVLHDYVPPDEKQSILASADCALVTLRDFALGIMSPSKLHAYLAMGLPILYIGPAGSNVDAAIATFNCGASFRKGDAAGIAAFLRKLRDEPSYRTELCHRARQAFDQAYCDTRTLPKFDEAFAELLRQ